MIDESRLDAYRRIVEEETVRNDDVDDIARQIEELQRERRARLQQKGINMDAKQESKLDYGQALETDPFADLSEEELAELELSPQEIDFTALSSEQQVRYWSLLSPGEKLLMVRLHLKADRDEIAHRLQLPSRVLKLLEEDKFSQLPTSSAIRHYYRTYASELGIEPEQLIHQYEVITGQLEKQPVDVKTNFFASLKNLQSRFILITLAAFVIGVTLIAMAVKGSWFHHDAAALIVPPSSKVNNLSQSEREDLLDAVDQGAGSGVTYGASETVNGAVQEPASLSDEP